MQLCGQTAPWPKIHVCEPDERSCELGRSATTDRLRGGTDVRSTLDRSLPGLVRARGQRNVADGPASARCSSNGGAECGSQPPERGLDDPDRDGVNEGTVTVITAPAGGATSVFGSDMARVLDNDDSVRVLPVLGKGPVRNVVDVLYLKSIDMGIITTDVPEFYKLQYKIPDVTSRLRYIAKLYHNGRFTLLRAHRSSRYSTSKERGSSHRGADITPRR